MLEFLSDPTIKGFGLGLVVGFIPKVWSFIKGKIDSYVVTTPSKWDDVAAKELEPLIEKGISAFILKQQANAVKQAQAAQTTTTNPTPPVGQ